MVHLIETASVPVLKIHTTSGIPVDITITHRNHSGCRARTIIQEFLQNYSELRPLVLVLKQFLRQNGLHNPYTGGLGSYCLVLMVTSFLQVYTYSEPGGKVNKNLGTLLMDFLQLYGMKFEFDRVVIKVTEAGGHIQLQSRSSYNLLVLDPCAQEQQEISPRNNVGNSTFMMYKVKDAFKMAAQQPQHFMPVLMMGINTEKVRIKELLFCL